MIRIKVSIRVIALRFWTVASIDGRDDHLHWALPTFPQLRSLTITH